MEKFSSIVKPCQSGKTRVVIGDIRADMEKCDKDILHVVLCNNNLLLMEQSNSRIKNELVIHKNTPEERRINSTSWDSKNNKFSIAKLTEGCMNDSYDLIVTCCNGKRMDHVMALIQNLEESGYSRRIKLWIDEADRVFKTWSKFINIFITSDIIQSVISITATYRIIADRFTKLKIPLKIKPLGCTYNCKTYYGCMDYEQNLKDCDSKCLDYATQILDHNPECSKPGVKAFIPADFKQLSHEEIALMLKTRGFAVFLLNGNRKELILPDGETYDIPDFQEGFEEIGDTIRRMYNLYECERFPVAITGYLCIGRGLTFQSPGFVFDYGIISNNGASRGDIYQIAGRLSGNIRSYKNFKRSVIYTSHKLMAKILEEEQIAINLAILAGESDSNEINLKDMVRAANFQEYKNYEVKNQIVEHSGGSKGKLPPTEVNDMLKSLNLDYKPHRYSQKKKIALDGKIFWKTTTSSSEIKSLDDLLEELDSFKPTANIPKELIVGETYTRLYHGYKDPKDTESITFVIRVVRRLK